MRKIHLLFGHRERMYNVDLPSEKITKQIIERLFSEGTAARQRSIYFFPKHK